MENNDPVLQHETRRMIYYHIVAHPGVPFNILKEVFGLADGTLRYHLDYLVRAEKISNSFGEGRRIYYPNHTNHPVGKVVDGQPQVHKFNDAQQRLVGVIRRYPGICQKELTQKTNLNRFAVRYNLTKLMEIGVVRKVAAKNKVCYEYISSGHMQFEVLKTLIVKLLNGEIDEVTFLELKRKIESN